MKRSSLSVLVLLTGAILLWGCGGGGYAQSGSTNVTVSVGSVASSAAVEPRAPTIPSEVASLRLTVSSTATAADMTPIVDTLAVTPGVTIYELSVTVPNGTRRFLLEAFDNTGTLRYRGDATMVLAGGTASVTIQMSATVAFSQADLAGTWDGVFFDIGNNAGWWRGTATIDGSGSVTVTSGVLSDGSTSIPAAGSHILTISSTGVVTESGSDGNPPFHGQMSSNKQLVIGTEDRGTDNTVTLRVFRKRTGTVFSNADFANKTFTFHGLRSGAENAWNYGTGSTNASSVATPTSEVGPAGPHAPGTGGTFTVNSVGIVTISNDNTWYGLVTDDKKVMFVIDGASNNVGFIVVTITGQTYTQPDYAGIYNWSTIRNAVTPAGIPMWIYGTSSVDAAGTGTYLSYTDSFGSATPANYTRLLSASGVITDPADATAHGQMSYNKDIIVRTNTNPSGRYGIIIGFKTAGTASGTVSAPGFSPVAGTYTSAQSVTLSTSTPGAAIRYTTDGSTPTSTTGTVYSVPIAVSATTTIKAIAYLAGWPDSAVTSGAYTIAGSGNISGLVRDAVAGTPLADASISVLQQGAVVASALTDAAGTYTVPVPAGSGYSIAISKAGYIPTDYQNVSVTTGTTIYLEPVLQIDVAHSGPGNVSGTIVNALTSVGVQGLSMQLRAGINVNTGTIVASTTTQGSGVYSISNLNAGQYTAQVGGTGYNTTYFTIVSIGGATTGNQNATITPILSTQETRIILTWGLTPEDLDSHLTGPLPDGTRFHMFYPYAGDLGSPWPTYVKLDLDDTTNYGPETTTIYQQIPGTYRFSVHDFTNQFSTNSFALSGSGAQVRVYQGGNLVANFNVPANQAATLWTVFEMDGTTITPINTMSNVSDSTLVLSPSRVGSAGKDATLFRNLPLKR